MQRALRQPGSVRSVCDRTRFFGHELTRPALFQGLPPTRRDQGERFDHGRFVDCQVPRSPHVLSKIGQVNVILWRGAFDQLSVEHQLPRSSANSRLLVHFPVDVRVRPTLRPGELEYQSVNRAPSRATRSRCGVRKSVAPMHEKSPYPWSSMRKAMKFGLVTMVDPLLPSRAGALPDLLIHSCRRPRLPPQSLEGVPEAGGGSSPAAL